MILQSQENLLFVIINQLSLVMSLCMCMSVAISAGQFEKIQIFVC